MELVETPRCDTASLATANDVVKSAWEHSIRLTGLVSGVAVHSCSTAIWTLTHQRVRGMEEEKKGEMTTFWRTKHIDAQPRRRRTRETHFRRSGLLVQSRVCGF